MKTHGQRKQRCFSMKWSNITMQPNIMRKSFYSQILQQHFRLFISMKARKCIMKKGSFDNYIMLTKPAQIDSKFGLYLKKLMEQKKADPTFKVPYIVGTATVAKTRKSQYWEYHNVPSIHVPLNVRVTTDLTKHYIKSPQEMTRLELAELEKELREIEDEAEDEDKKGEKGVEDQDEEEEESEAENDDDLKRGKKKRAIRKAAKAERDKEQEKEDELGIDPDAEDAPKKFEVVKMTFTELDRIKHKKALEDPDFVEYINQMKALMPMRNGVIRRYFEKYKYQKKKREDILASALESEEFIAKLMGDEYVPLLD